MAIGVPTGAQFGAELLAFSTFTAILGSLGATQIAAHQASLAIIRTSFLPGIAVGEAACVLVGQAVGRKRLDEADRVTRASLVIASVFMAVCGVAFAVFGEPIARAMVNGDEVVEVVRKLLLVAAVFQVLDAFNIVLRGALRGAKDVRVPAIMGISIVWTCIPVAAYLLGKLAGMGAIGGWCGFIAETLFATILFSMRWKRGAWRARVLA
jgi:MATE family multidrug resistance protein